MAILIPLRRVFGDDDLVAYDFFDSRDERGRLVIDKHTGEVTLDEAETNDNMTDFTSSRAVRAARKLWERREYPLETDYRA